MGIKGLIDLVKDESVPVKLSKYRGRTIVVDVSCWIHRGSYACCMELALGQKTEAYVTFCLKYIHMLLSHDIKPILVFDGVELPAKDAITLQRRSRREQSFQKGKELLRNGNSSAARQAFAQSISITPEMTQSVMKACRLKGVDCVVAPYEADAEIAFLLKIGVAQAVITEDSDLLAFGCKKVLLKTDLNGNALEVDLKRVFSSKDFLNFDMEKFRRMCILSGCDYLPDGLPGVGLKRALKVFQTALSNDITVVLKRIGNYLKKSVEVSEEYISKFIEAENTFKYQLVFDPLARKIKPLNDYPAGTDASSYPYCGRVFDSNLAFQIALGNVNVKTLQKMACFMPNLPIVTNSKLQQDMNVVLSSQGQSDFPPHRLSIWNPSYLPMNSSENDSVKKANKDVSNMSEESKVYGRPNFTNRIIVKKVLCPPLLTTSATTDPNIRPQASNSKEERDNLSIMYLEANFCNKNLGDTSAKENQRKVLSVDARSAELKTPQMGVKRPRASMDNAMLGSLTEGCRVSKRRKETENLIRENAICAKQIKSPSKSLIDQLVDDDLNTCNEIPDAPSPDAEKKVETTGSPRTVVDTGGRLCIDELFAESYNQRLAPSASRALLSKGKPVSKCKTISGPATKITRLLQKSPCDISTTIGSAESDIGNASRQYVPPSKRLFPKSEQEATKLTSLKPEGKPIQKFSQVTDESAQKLKLYKLENFVPSTVKCNSETLEHDRMPLLPSQKILSQTMLEDSKESKPEIVEVTDIDSDAQADRKDTGSERLILEILDDQNDDACRMDLIKYQGQGDLANKSNIAAYGKSIWNMKKPSNALERKSSKVHQCLDKQSKLAWGQPSTVKSTNSQHKVVKSQYFC